MSAFSAPAHDDSPDSIATLRDILQRIAQAERPGDFAFIKQVLLERVAALEAEAAPTPIAASRR
jgi:hypothetical protein